MLKNIFMIAAISLIVSLESQAIRREEIMRALESNKSGGLAGAATQVSKVLGVPYDLARDLLRAYRHNQSVEQFIDQVIKTSTIPDSVRSQQRPVPRPRHGRAETGSEAAAAASRAPSPIHDIRTASEGQKRPVPRPRPGKADKGFVGASAQSMMSLGATVAQEAARRPRDAAAWKDPSFRPRSPTVESRSTVRAYPEALNEGGEGSHLRPSDFDTRDENVKQIINNLSKEGRPSSAIVQALLQAGFRPVRK